MTSTDSLPSGMFALCGNIGHEYNMYNILVDLETHFHEYNMVLRCHFQHQVTKRPWFPSCLAFHSLAVFLLPNSVLTWRKQVTIYCEYPQKGPCCRELMSLANSQWEHEAYQQSHEGFKVNFFPGQGKCIPVNALVAALWLSQSQRHSAKLYPDSWPTEIMKYLL